MGLVSCLDEMSIWVEVIFFFSHGGAERGMWQVEAISSSGRGFSSGLFLASLMSLCRRIWHRGAKMLGLKQLLSLNSTNP